MSHLRTVIVACAAALAAAAITPAQAGKPAGNIGGNWVITMTDLNNGLSGSEANSVNELGEIVGHATNASGLPIRPIWKDGMVIGDLPGIDGVVYTWNNQREAVGIDVINTKISCHVYWIPGGSGQLPPLPGAPSCATGAYDVNAHGEMAGGAQGFNGTSYVTQPVTWKNGQIYRNLGMPPGAVRAVGSGINDFGDLVGTVYFQSGLVQTQHAFLYSNGLYTILPALSSNFGSQAYDINNNGDILGVSGGGYPVVWRNGATEPTRLAVPDGVYPRSVHRINDNGDVVGSVNHATGYEAVLWRNGEYIPLGRLPGGTESYAYDINNSGLIVGVSTIDPPYSWHAMSWTVTTKSGKPPRR